MSDTTKTLDSQIECMAQQLEYDLQIVHRGIWYEIGLEIGRAVVTSEVDSSRLEDLTQLARQANKATAIYLRSAVSDLT